MVTWVQYIVEPVCHAHALGRSFLRQMPLSSYTLVTRNARSDPRVSPIALSSLKRHAEHKPSTPSTVCNRDATIVNGHGLMRNDFSERPSGRLIRLFGNTFRPLTAQCTYCTIARSQASEVECLLASEVSRFTPLVSPHWDGEARLHRD